MRWLAVALLLALAGCGSDDPLCEDGGWQLTSGINICSEEYVDLNEVDYMVEKLEEEVSVRYPFVKNLPSSFYGADVHMTFVATPLAAKCEEIYDGVYSCERHIAGVNDRHTIFVQYAKCLASTAFAHELMHSIEHIYFNGVKSGHKREWFFIRGGTTPVSDTVEFLMLENGVRDLYSCEALRTDAPL